MIRYTSEEYGEIAFKKAKEQLNLPKATRKEIYPHMVGILSAMLEQKDSYLLELVDIVVEADKALSITMSEDVMTMNALLKLRLAINKLKGKFFI